jgi:cytochrome c551/c552
VRELGYTKLFDRTRKACVNCHAPANVLDLLDSRPAAASAEGSLGVECTPNLLREPRGVIPAARGDEIELGVDCTSCHVGRQGIVGPGRRPASAHEVVADSRFQDPARTSETLCQTCHGSTVRAWRRTSFASQGVTCLDCHMPATTAASTTAGPERRRRSHRFLADKDRSLLERATHASLELTRDRKARFRIVNDRVGHYFPSGGNWLSVKLGAYDGGGRLIREQIAVFGREEPLLLDFWPFNLDRRIASGDEREVLFALPAGPGLVEAVVRYHDWMRTKAIVATLKKQY